MCWHPSAARRWKATIFPPTFRPDDSSPGGQIVRENFKAKYNSTPDSMAALGYDSAMILADAIKRAGTTDGAKVRDAIAATKDFHGAAARSPLMQTATPPSPPSS
jgi:branched-chain amino acid transport system substrate-binding protein